MKERGFKIRLFLASCGRGTLSLHYFERNVTKVIPHKSPKSIASGKLTFDERAALHRVVLLHLPQRCALLRVQGLGCRGLGFGIRISGSGSLCGVPAWNAEPGN